jgi:hypothetical protein
MPICSTKVKCLASNADLLYKGKVLSVEGIVTAITNNHAGGAVGEAYIASPAEVKRLGGRAALDGVVARTGTNMVLFV